MLFGKLRPYLAKVMRPRSSGTCSTELLVLRPSSEVDSEFLWHQLLSRGFIAWINAATYGAKMPRANPDQIGNSEAVLPPLEEQRAIAAFLDRETGKIDALVAKKEELIKLLQEKRTALITHAVTKGLDPNAPMKDSGIEWLGEIPATWKVQRCKFVFALLNGYAFEGEYFSRDDLDAPILVTPGNFNPSGGIYFDQGNTTCFSGPYDERYALQKGDLLIVLTDLSYKKLILGRCVIVDRKRLLLNQRVAKILVHQRCAEKVDIGFLELALNSTAARDQVVRTARGATVFHSSPGKIGDVVLALPPPGEQPQIVRSVAGRQAELRAAINQINAGVASLKELRTALISSAVTGKIDVRAASAEASAGQGGTA